VWFDPSGDGTEARLRPQLAQRRALDERRCHGDRDTFAGRVRRNGDWGDGEWTAIITGQRLKSVFDKICEGRRLSVKRSGQADADKPEVDAIEIVAYPN
jgi:hypothetical protein